MDTVPDLCWESDPAPATSVSNPGALQRAFLSRMTSMKQRGKAAPVQSMWLHSPRGVQAQPCTQHPGPPVPVGAAPGPAVPLPGTAAGSCTPGLQENV